uniref:Uncharacterized protein n=1 Tax=Rhizophora mucronata TaxID=61149 RepID=A0A2P2L9Q3_RHIMU
MLTNNQPTNPHSLLCCPKAHSANSSVHLHMNKSNTSILQFLSLALIHRLLPFV